MQGAEVAPRRDFGAADWAVVGLLVLAFAPALLALSEVWRSVDYYSHGVLVPAVALLLALRERDRLGAAPTSRSGAGLVLVLLALVLYAVGSAGGLLGLQGLALVGAVAAAVLWLRGPAWLRILAFPTAYLLFMVPLPEPWIAPVIVKLRLFVTSAAVAVLHAAGMPVLREGNVLLLPGGESLFVADACSGVTSLITLTPLGVLVAYLTERQLWRRLVLVASVLPIAMLFNLLRVLGTVVAAQSVGAERATSGGIHEAAGLLTYAVGCGALLGVGAVLRRIRPAP